MARSDRELRGKILEYLRKHHGDICRHWFDDLDMIGVEGGVLRFVVAEPVRLRYLQRTATNAFSEAAQAVTGRLLPVRFLAPLNGQSATRFPDRSSGIGSAPMLDGSDTPASLDEQMVLSPDFSFDQFVVGPENRLAHAAALAVADRPGRAYNPFVIHGGVGLGKTHLLQAVCQAVLARQPSARVVYISCATFIDAFHECVKAGRMPEFRHRFRNVDLLVIDDVHLLSRHEQTQDEFFHTFNALHQSGRQIMLSSDVAPTEIPALEERLTSRFNSGLVARVDRPSFETRVAIIKAKAKLQQLEIPDDVPAYVAARIDTNIRELEGALARIRAMAQANIAPVSLDVAKQALAQEPRRDSERSPSIHVIIEAVTRYYNLKVTDLLGKKRHKSVALPRQVAMWLARRHTRYSLEEIGGHIGGRDHSTVLHAVRTVDHRRQIDGSLSSDVARLERSLARRDEETPAQE
ncbi:MAG: chromosomal replication initiator protein DnaA [Phycisphaeraceae bacterium]|nr:chromosomal replication initiator protein DnaA [Phycisphaeraceae bacterium]